MHTTRTRLRPPYKPNGSTSFPARKRSGVYLIHEPGFLSEGVASQPVYIGMGGKDVYKALYRHFQTWNDKTRERVTYGKFAGYSVRMIYTATVEQAARLERALILKYQPRDNPDKLQNHTLTAEMKNTATAALRSPIEDAPF